MGNQVPLVWGSVRLLVLRLSTNSGASPFLVGCFSLLQIYARCYVTPLLGAYIADTYLGRFNTICVAVVIALIGHIILIVAAVPGVIEHSSAVGAFAVALIVMGLGACSAASID